MKIESIHDPTSLVKSAHQIHVGENCVTVVLHFKEPPFFSYVRGGNLIVKFERFEDGVVGGDLVTRVVGAVHQVVIKCSTPVCSFWDSRQGSDLTLILFGDGILPWEEVKIR